MEILALRGCKIKGNLIVYCTAIGATSITAALFAEDSGFADYSSHHDGLTARFDLSGSLVGNTKREKVVDRWRIDI